MPDEISILQPQLESLQSDYDRMARATELSELAASIAHEINQPLAATVNFVEAARCVLAADGETDEVSNLLKQAASEALRAGDIVRRIRTFLHGEARQTAILSATTLMEEALRIAMIDARDHNIKVIRRFAPEDSEVEVDRVEIQQILVNFLRNAIDAFDGYRSDAEPRLEITVCADDPLVRFSIADNGPGIPLDVRERMFEPFYTSKAQGLGFGLSISRRLAQAHGGSITIDDRPGGGTIVSLSIPRASDLKASAARVGPSNGDNAGEQ